MKFVDDDDDDGQVGVSSLVHVGCHKKYQSRAAGFDEQVLQMQVDRCLTRRVVRTSLFC